MFRRNGVTIVELITVIGIVAVLLSLLLAGVLATRESARKVSCSNRIRQVGMAVSNYEAAYRQFPPGSGSGFSVHVRLLPFLELSGQYDRIDFSIRGGDQRDSSWTSVPDVFICPSDPFTTRPANNLSCNYVGITGGTAAADNNGLIVATSKHGRRVTVGMVTDGLSSTLMFSEAAAFLSPSIGDASRNVTAATYRTPRKFDMPEELAAFSDICFSDQPLSQLQYGLGSDWIEESIGFTRFDCIYPKQKRNCANRGSMVSALFAPSSLHSGGVYGVFGDGSVSLVNQTIDAEIWQALGTRDGGEVFVLN